LLDRSAEQLPAGWRLEALPNGAVLTLPNGRTQRVRVERQGERYVLSSVALGAQRVQLFDRHKLAVWLWEINRELGVVGLMLDRQGRLVGRIEQLAETLDAPEFALYLQLLARECDRLEYVLSGQDYG
jgi:hypothetical protein